LEHIEGIGKKTADALLKRFRSVNKVRQASEEELVDAVGAAKARLIRAHFAEPAGADGGGPDGASGGGVNIQEAAADGGAGANGTKVDEGGGDNEGGLDRG